MTLVDCGHQHARVPAEGRGTPVTVEQIVRAVEVRADVARSEIERMVVQEFARFRDVRVTLYVPLLVERAVLVRLRLLPDAEDTLDHVAGGPAVRRSGAMRRG